MSRPTLAPSQSAQVELNRRKLARINPWAFACYVDPHYAKPYSYPHAKLIFDYFKRAESGELWSNVKGHGAKILIVTLPPNHLKSSILNKCAAWFVGKRKRDGKPHQMALVSYGADLAETNSKVVINTIQEPLYHNVFPSVALSHPNPSPKKWRLAGQGMGDTVKAVGIDGPLTGHRAHCMIIDDPIKSAADAASSSARYHRQQWWLTVASTRLTPISFVVLVLTRWHNDDLAGWLIQESVKNPLTDRIVLLRIPALAETHKERVAAHKTLGLPVISMADPLNRQAGEALCPEIKDKAAHEARRRAAPAAFASLDQGLPTPAGGYMIGRDSFQLIDTLPADAKIKWAWCLDFAYTKKEAAPTKRNDPDFTVVAKIGAWYFDANDPKQVRLVIAYVKRDQLKMAEAKQMVKDHIVAHGGDPCPIVAFSQNIDKIGMESLATDPDLFGYRVKLFTAPKGDKVVRAQPWMDRAALGFVYLLKGSWVEHYLAEAEAFPRGAHDDQIDATTVGYHFHGLAKTRKKAGTRRKPKGWF